jgi:plasmid stabilization system protein ParE
MAYRVDISLPALTDAEEAYRWLKEHSPARAGDWYEGLLETIFSLENFPTRCPLAPESEDLGKEIRQLLYGKRGRVYRILFGITRDEKADEDIVRIFRIWHSARARAKASDIKEGESKEY